MTAVLPGVKNVLGVRSHITLDFDLSFQKMRVAYKGIQTSCISLLSKWLSSTPLPCFRSKTASASVSDTLWSLTMNMIVVNLSVDLNVSDHFGSKHHQSKGKGHSLSLNSLEKSDTRFTLKM